jgi:RIO kinase 1
MRIPPRLQQLFADSLIDEVMFQLMSGKEAEVYVVRTGETLRCAKIYKEAKHRSFKQMTQYTEGRKTRDSRQARAMGKKTRFGKEEAESEWQNTEVETLELLGRAGVRVPETFAYVDGVLLMEMVRDPEGNPAPRLQEVDLEAKAARTHFQTLVQDVVKMLCCGIVHGDLSEFNVLLAHDGPTIIDFPQAVQATANNAGMIFERDLNHLVHYFGRFDPEIQKMEFSKEIWNLYRNGKLRPDTVPTGLFQDTTAKANLANVFEAIQGANEDDEEKRGIRPIFKQRRI